jgi:hypothetical protein
MQLDPHPTQFLSLREIGLGVNRDNFGVIWSEKRWIPACFGVKNGLFLRFFPVKSSAFKTVRGKRGGVGVRRFGPLRLVVLWIIVRWQSDILCK